MGGSKVGGITILDLNLVGGKTLEETMVYRWKTKETQTKRRILPIAPLLGSLAGLALGAIVDPAIKKIFGGKRRRRRRYA